MKDEEMRNTIEGLDKKTKILKITLFEYNMLKCLNNINDNLDDIRLHLREIQNHLTGGK